VAADQREFVARRERLSLRALVATGQGGDAAQSAVDAAKSGVDVDLGNYVGLRVGDTLWVSATPLSTGETRTSALAAALAWHSRESGVASINIVDAHTPGLTARRAMHFAVPVTVFDTRTATIAAPRLHEPRSDARHEHVALASRFLEVGADVVVEHGVVAAEVLGLEVARVIDEDGVPTIRIGVGAHDREMFKLVNGATTTIEQLRGVVHTVAQHRRDGAPTHPLNLLAPERALRARVIRDPGLVGAKKLNVAEPPVQRENVKDSVPCCAIGEDEQGPIVLVFVAGIDLDAVPFAADARSSLAPNARLLIVTASRNIVPTQLRMARMLKKPAEFVSA
jgi:hypothetical protein